MSDFTEVQVLLLDRNIDDLRTVVNQFDRWLFESVGEPMPTIPPQLTAQFVDLAREALRAWDRQQ